MAKTSRDSKSVAICEAGTCLTVENIWEKDDEATLDGCRARPLTAYMYCDSLCREATEREIH